jgi:hypothetical protein
MPKHRKSRGGGFTTQLSNMINPGNPVFQQYDGAGKDCAGEVVRPGYMDMYSSKGLPGLSGGRRHSRRQRHSGGTALVPAYVENYGVSAPGVVPVPTPTPSPAPAQKGGRYEVTPGFYNSAAIGASSYAPIGRIPCEASATAVPTRGGKRRSRRRRTRGKTRGKTRGGVNMGEVSSMAYNAPTAGYRNDFQAFPSGGAVPGLMLQVPYDARAGNPACGTTGGKRSKRSKRSTRRVRFNGGSLADNAAPVAALTVDQVQTRADFDGSNKGLPVKFGGARRSKRSKRGRRSCFSLKKFFHL